MLLHLFNRKYRKYWAFAIWISAFIPIVVAQVLISFYGWADSTIYIGAALTLVLAVLYLVIDEGAE